MFTTECSNVMPKNTMIGIHIAITLPLTEVEIMAPTTRWTPSSCRARRG